MTEIKKAGDGDSPIKVVSRHLACENTKFFVYFDYVIDKAGGEVRGYLMPAQRMQERILLLGWPFCRFSTNRSG